MAPLLSSRPRICGPAFLAEVLRSETSSAWRLHDLAMGESGLGAGIVPNGLNHVRLLAAAGPDFPSRYRQ